MNHVLVTGMSGVGKSSVLEEMRSRGFACIDMDDEGTSTGGPMRSCASWRSIESADASP